MVKVFIVKSMNINEGNMYQCILYGINSVKSEYMNTYACYTFTHYFLFGIDLCVTCYGTCNVTR